MHWRQQLRIRTNDPPFLWRMTIGILLAGVALAFAVQYLPTPFPDDQLTRLMLAAGSGEPSEALAELDALLADADAPFEDTLDALPLLSALCQTPDPEELLRQFDGSQAPPVFEPIDPQEVARRLALAKLAGSRREIAAALWRSLLAEGPTDELTRLAGQSPPPRYANYALGVFRMANDEPYAAADAFEREGELPDARRARQRAVRVYLAQDDTEALERLAADERYTDEIPALARLYIGVSQRDWPGVWWLIPRNTWEQYQLGPVLLALFAGLCWLLIALQCGQVALPRGARWWLCLAALPLGALSVWPTLFIGLWQEEVWGLEESANLFAGLKYFVVGVGLREELCKLLLILPLVPLLVRRGSELEALIVSACVGLGFAIEENTGYFAASAGTSTLGRFLTANFFHMAATGLIGLALLRALRHPRERGLEFPALFGVIVLAHGFYDATISLPDLVEYNLLGSIIYILLAYQFFHELRSLRSTQPETISLTANFLGGVSLLASVTLVYLSYRVGLEPALRILIPELLSTALMAYMFLREMPNSLLRPA